MIFTFNPLDLFPLKNLILSNYVGWDSTVSTATHYGLHGLGIEPQWGRNFTHLSRLVLWSTQPPVLWVLGLFLVVKQQGMALTTHFYLALRLKKEKSHTSTPLWAFIDCSVGTFTFTSSQPISLSVIFPPPLPSLQLEIKFPHHNSACIPCLPLTLYTYSVQRNILEFTISHNAAEIRY